MSLPEPSVGPRSRFPGFWNRVAVGSPEECWIWLGHLNDGYGRLMLHRRNVYAYRLAWELFGNPSPAGYELDHLCRNRACVNPAHLELVTHRENTLRGRGITATHASQDACHVGHPLTHVVECGRLRRRCKTCAEAARQRYREKHGHG